MNNDKPQELPPAEPHGPLENVFTDIWIVRGGNKLSFLQDPISISKNMIIVRNPQTVELTLINSMRVSDELLTEIASLGDIKNVITLGEFHGKDDGFYRERFSAKVYALEGHTYSRSIDIPDSSDEGFMKADVYLTEESVLPLENAELKIIHGNLIEGVIYLKAEGGILITADALRNTPTPDEFVSPKPESTTDSPMYKAFTIGPGWYAKAKPDAQEMKSALLETTYEHVLPGHGDIVIGDALEKFRPAIEAAIKSRK